MCLYDAFGEVNALRTCKRAMAAIKRGHRPSEALMGQILAWLADSEAKAAQRDAELAAQAHAWPLLTVARNPLDEIDRLSRTVDELRTELALK